MLVCQSCCFSKLGTHGGLYMHTVGLGTHIAINTVGDVAYTYTSLFWQTFSTPILVHIVYQCLGLRKRSFLSDQCPTAEQFNMQGSNSAQKILLVGHTKIS